MQIKQKFSTMFRCSFCVHSDFFWPLIRSYFAEFSGMIIIFFSVFFQRMRWTFVWSANCAWSLLFWIIVQIYIWRTRTGKIHWIYNFRGKDTKCKSWLYILDIFFPNFNHHNQLLITNSSRALEYLVTINRGKFYKHDQILRRGS